MQQFGVIVGCVLILYGVFRLVWLNTHNRSNVSLTSWMLTGGLPALLVGITEGVVSLIKRRVDENGLCVIALIVGVLFLMAVL